MIYLLFRDRQLAGFQLLDSKADACLRSRMSEAYRNKGRNFGNGRYVRNIFEKAITVQANRLSKTKKSVKRRLATPDGE